MEPIDRIRDELRALPSYQTRLEGITSCIRKAETEVATLLRTYESERRDVEKLQQESFSAFALRLFGAYANRLEREQREELAAKIAYDEAAAHLEELLWEARDVKAKIAALQQKAREYDAELTARRRTLQQRLSDPDGRHHQRLEEERQLLCSQITEVDEAIRVASRAAATAQTALESLRKAEDWATYDIFTNGGLISHAAKYSHVDAAQSCFHHLRSQLAELKRELADVHDLQSPQLTEVSGSQRMVDYWFDNIFTDLSVRSQIQDNAAQIRQIQDGISRVKSTLSSKSKELNAQLEQNRRQEEELLLRM
ncbi:hypothetical protein LJC63_03890 [Ruminococcaceae bacterium OttesenSCG-928-L11]|nr:hypothetical protein [Ruminococcaceae bacterium OttesenSCG-928-L11]